MCGEPVVEGQRFAWIPGRGYAHFECLLSVLRERFNGSVPGDVLALVEAEEALAYAITRLKQARWAASSDGVRGVVDELRARVEGVAARAAKALAEVLEERGVVL